MNLNLIETELRKRWKYPYKWGRRQNNDWDNKTNFIYKITNFEELEKKLIDFSDDLKNYALNRWYNFYSAQAVEYIFNQNERVIPCDNSKDKLIDFYIDNIAFDHKSSVFPKGFHNDRNYAKTHPLELVKWLYSNQSQQGRKHLRNRLFLIFYDKMGEHWKLKAELGLISKKIDQFLSEFKEDQLIKVEESDFQCVSDIIWIEN